MDKLGDLLRRKADDIDDSGVKGDLSLAQIELDRHFNGAVRARQLKSSGVLVVETRNSSLASEIRLKQYQLLSSLDKTLKNKLVRIQIRIS